MVKDLEKYLCRRSLLSKVACCRPIALLKTNSFASKEPFNNEEELLWVCVVDVFLHSVMKKQEWVRFYFQCELRNT